MATPLNQLMPIESALTPAESQWFKSNAPHFLEALRLQQTVINQLIIRTGGSGSGSTVTDLSDLTAQIDSLEEDYVSTASADLRAQVALDAATIVSVSITSAVSPYTQSSRHERIYVDASGGAVTVNLLPVAADIYCDVIKQDSSTNAVTVASTDLIDGETSQSLLYQYESIEIAGNASGYVII